MSGNRILDPQPQDPMQHMYDRVLDLERKIDHLMLEKKPRATILLWSYGNGDTLPSTKVLESTGGAWVFWVTGTITKLAPAGHTWCAYDVQKDGYFSLGVPTVWTEPAANVVLPTSTNAAMIYLPVGEHEILAEELGDGFFGGNDFIKVVGLELPRSVA